MRTPDVVCATLEVALNRYLQLDEAVLAECASLDGRQLALQVDGLGWELVLRPHAHGVQVCAVTDDVPDVRLSGAPLALLREGWTVLKGEGRLPQGLRVEGDAELLGRFNRLLARVGFDPEEMMARVLGDAAAHRLVQGAGALLGWGRGAASTLALNTAEYLREETYDLVHRADLEQWMEAVDGVRERTDRLAARIEQLERRTAP